MPHPLRCLVLTSSLFAFAAVQGQDVIPHHQDRPPGPALSPQQAIAQMMVPEGFTVELVASEPDIVNPVAMTFDERGRIWITESLEYPRKTPGAGQDRIKILEDTDADGRADKFTIFAEGLNIPSGIAVGYGGVWVANSPDILFYPDADRDGRPDGEPKTIVTGFGRTDTHELPNSLTWGPDGYLYGLNGVFNHSHVKYAPDNPNYKGDHPGWQFTCACFRINPVTREFEIFCEGTSNPWGLAFDHEGSAFVSACVIDHLWHLVRTGYYHRQGGPYPPFTWKIDSIVKHKHQKAAYCGLHYYDSDAYPEQFRNKLYMGNIHGGCINVDKLQRDGSTYFATGEPDFLTANDAWFMPVAQKTGPDGCLYVLDWYDRYHCYQDANRDPPGIDRLKGRLYRVRYKDTPRAKPFDLAKENDEELFDRLNSGNDLFRDLALRLLVERRAQRDFSETDPILQKADALINAKGGPEFVRLRAANVAASLRRPPDHVLYHLYRSDSEKLCRTAIRCIGNFGGTPAQMSEMVVQFTDQDLSPTTLLELAITAGIRANEADGDKMRALVNILYYSRDDKLIKHIVWRHLEPLLESHAAEFADHFRNPLPLPPAMAAIMPRAIDRLLARKSFEVKPVTDLFLGIRDNIPNAASECLRLIAIKIETGEIRGERLTQLRDAIQPAIARLIGQANNPIALDAAILAVSWKDTRGLDIVRTAFLDPNADLAVRIRAFSSLIVAGDSQALDLVSTAFSQRNRSPEFVGQLLTALGRLDDPQVSTVVLNAYGTFPATEQPKAIELLTQRAAWAKPLIEAIAAGKISANLLNVNQVQRLLALNDPALSAAVNKHWGTIRTTRDPAREQLVAEMRRLLRTTSGDPHRGIEVFNRVCGQCHKIYGQGQEVGPDITSNGRASYEQLLSNVFDPSLVIGAAYQARTVQATDGRIITGLLAEDSQDRVVLKLQGGKLETIPRADIEAQKTSELSLMPEGLEKQLKLQELADLFAFISLDKHPDDPTARPIPTGPMGKK